MKSNTQRLHSTLLKLDQFGEPVEFTVDGDGSRKSFFGLLLSLVIFATVIPYSIDKYRTLVEYGDTSISEDFYPHWKKPTDVTKIPELSVAIQIMNVGTLETIKVDDYFDVYA